MIYLLLSIAMSSLIQVIFKYYSKYRIDNYQAIPFNYLVCVIMGMILAPDTFSGISEGVSQGATWVIHSLLLGILFILIFIGMARCAQEISISVSTVAAKMGVALPVLYGFFFLKEASNAGLVTGIVLSFASIFLVARLHPEHHLKGTLAAFLPVVVFAGSGVIDLNLKIMQIRYLADIETHWMVTTIFGGAFISGTMLIFWRMHRHKQRLERENVLAGILLGIPNYFSIYFLVMALNQPGYDTVFVMPLNNIGIVLLSVLLSIWLFSEKLTPRLKLGILTSLVSIILIGIWGN